MTWKYWHENDTNPLMQLTAGVFLDNSNKVRRLMELAGLEDKQNTQVLICIWKWVPCSRVTIYCHNKIQTLSLISPSRRMSASFCFYKFKEGNKHSLYSSSDDESIPICFPNLRMEGFIPIKGPSSFDFMSSTKVSSFFRFMFRNSAMTKKTLGWNFS